MKTLELLLDYLAVPSFKRWLHLLLIIATLLCATWIVDSYTNYTQLYKIERRIGLLERLNQLEKTGGSSEKIKEVSDQILDEISRIRKSAEITPNKEIQATPWYARAWIKLAAGGLPWFFISLFALSGVFRKEKNSLAGFFAIQIFTIIFAVINYFIPQFGSFWLDYVLVPWGLFFVCIVIPMSIASIAAFKKVRDNSLRKAITNNLRQLAAASDQFYLETGRNETTFEELVGPESKKYIKAINSVDGERYDLLDFKQGQPLVVFRRSGEAVKYEN